MDDRSPQLQIEILEVDDHERGAVLRMSGEIDLATVAKVREAFQELVDRKLTHLIVDASAVSFIDSTGLHALVEGKGAIHGAGSQVALIASAQVRRVLELVFPEPLFAARVDTMDQARAVLGW